MPQLRNSTVLLMLGWLTSVAFSAAAEPAAAPAVNLAPPPVTVSTFAPQSEGDLKDTDSAIVKDGWTAPAATGVAVGNGQLLILADDRSVRCCVLRDDKPVLLAEIKPAAPAPARITVQKYAAAKSTLQVEWGGKDAERLTISLKRGSQIAEIVPAVGMETLTMETALPHWVVPGFVGDDFACSAADVRPGTTLFVPAERLLAGFQGSGDTMVFLAWPEGEPSVNVTVGSQGLFSRLALRPEGKRFFVGGVATAGVWREIATDGDKVGEPRLLDWNPPFAAKWQATLVGPECISSWELLDGWAAQKGFMCGPHGFQVNVPWPFRYAARDKAKQVELTPPPPIVHRGAIRRALVYPIRREAQTPPAVFLAEDLLREAFDTGVCEYVQHREWSGTAAGGPLCALGARVAKLNGLCAGTGATLQYWRQNMDWQLEQGLEQYKRLREYRALAQETTKLCAPLQFPADSDPAKVLAQILADNRAIVESCDAALRNPMDGVREWRDFAPSPEATPEEALRAIAAAYREAMPKTDAEALSRINDLNTKLRLLANAPQTELPRPRRLTQSVRNGVSLLASYSSPAAQVAAKVRALSSATLNGKYWAEEGR